MYIRLVHIGRDGAIKLIRGIQLSPKGRSSMSKRPSDRTIPDIYSATLGDFVR